MQGEFFSKSRYLLLEIGVVFTPVSEQTSVPKEQKIKYYSFLLRKAPFSTEMMFVCFDTNCADTNEPSVSAQLTTTTIVRFDAWLICKQDARRAHS